MFHRNNNFNISASLPTTFHALSEAAPGVGIKLTPVGGRCDLSFQSNHLTSWFHRTTEMHALYCIHSVHKPPFLSSEKLFCGSQIWKRARSWRTWGQSASLSSTRENSKPTLILSKAAAAVHCSHNILSDRSLLQKHTSIYAHTCTLSLFTCMHTPPPRDIFYLCPCRDS